MTEKQEQIVLSYLEGKLSSEDRNAFESWLSESDENRKLLNDVKAIWEMTGQQPGLDFNTAEEWKKLSIVMQSEEKVTPVRKLHPNTNWLARVAAAIIFIVVCGGIIYFSFAPSNERVVESAEQEVNLTLPDGSKVTLNKKSRITYAEAGFDEKRTVSLDGEAFFDVVKNPDAPFTIEASNAVVKVLGTSFNVRAYATDTTAEVYVVTGKVSLADVKLNQPLLLAPGDLGVLASSGELNKLLSETNGVAWKERKLIFKNTSLHKVAKTLKSYFQVEMKFGEPAVEECHFTGTFDDPALDEVLESLQLALNLQIVRQSDAYIINGHGCELK